MEVFALLPWLLLLGQTQPESPPDNVKELLSARRDIIAGEVEQQRKQLTAELFGAKEQDLKSLEDRLLRVRAELKDSAKSRGKPSADKTAIRQLRADIAKMEKEHKRLKGELDELQKSAAARIEEEVDTFRKKREDDLAIGPQLSADGLKQGQIGRMTVWKIGQVIGDREFFVCLYGADQTVLFVEQFDATDLVDDLNVIRAQQAGQLPPSARKLYGLFIVTGRHSYNSVGAGVRTVWKVTPFDEQTLKKWLGKEKPAGG
jgi:hypothetical protein